MSTDNTVTIHVAAEAVTRLVSDNSPALAARLALADFEGEFGRLPPGSYVEVAWRADSQGQPGARRYDDLAAVRAALPGAESPAAWPGSTSDSPFESWWPGTESASRSPVRTMAREAWAAALAWAAGQAEAAGCFCGNGDASRPILQPSGLMVLEHDPRCPLALAAKIRAGQP